MMSGVWLTFHARYGPSVIRLVGTHGSTETLGTLWNTYGISLFVAAPNLTESHRTGNFLGVSNLELSRKYDLIPPTVILLLPKIS